MLPSLLEWQPIPVGGIRIEVRDNIYCPRELICPRSPFLDMVGFGVDNEGICTGGEPSGMVICECG